MLRHRLHNLLVARLMRWLRSRVRLRVLQCWLVEVARRMPQSRLVMQLAVRVDQRQLRVPQQVLRWSEVEDHQMRLERLQVRRLVLEVEAHQRHRRRQAKLRVLQWWLMVGLLMRRLVQLEQRPRVREHLLIRQLRSRVRLREQRWCTRVGVSRMLWLQRRKVFVRLEDRLRLRQRQQRQRSKRQIRGTVVTTRVVVTIRRRMVVAGALLCTMQRALVRPPRQQEAHQVTLVRRLVGKHCEVVRVRQTLRKLQVLLQVRRW